MSQAILISFPRTTSAEGNKFADSLLPTLRESSRDVFVERRRQNPESQDPGATLALIVGSAAIGSLAKGIALWIARHGGTTVRIHTPDGTWVDVKNATGQDTAEIVEAALRKT